MKEEIQYFPKQETVEAYCHPSTGCCCPFLSCKKQTALCTRNSTLEQAHRTARSLKGLLTNTGLCTGQPLFLNSIEDNSDSMRTIKYLFSVGDKSVCVELTFYAYLRYEELAKAYNMSFQDYIRKVAITDLQKRNELD